MGRREDIVAFRSAEKIVFLLTDGAVSDYGPPERCVAFRSVEKIVLLLTGGAVSDYGVVGFCYSGGRIRLIVNVLAICWTSPADRRGACGLIFPGVLLWKPMLRTVYLPAAG